MSEVLSSVDACVDRTIAALGRNLIVAAPLGLGKPVQLLNAFYQRAVADPSISLHIVTALCLSVPRPANEIEARVSVPIMQRLFGDYEELAFLAPYQQDRLPANIRVTEVYFKAGTMKHNRSAQQNFIACNYTHMVRDMLALGVNVLVQMVAARDTAAGLSLSLSSNPDLTLELLDMPRDPARPLLRLAQVHDDLPFMELDAEVPAAAFDLIVRNPQYNRTLFAVPNAAVPLQDYATALHASSLIVDGGTLQLGIGALGDAIVHACVLRQEQNSEYRALLQHLERVPNPLAAQGVFDTGLYVSTEMFVNGLLRLLDCGILKRQVYDQLQLQQGLNAGAISACIDARLFAYGRTVGLIPKRLDAHALQDLQYWGIVADTVQLDGEQLQVDGERLDNDLDEPRVRAALLRAVAGRQLRNGRLLHAAFFLGPRDFYERLRHLDAVQRTQVCMTGVRRTNQLLLDYPLYCAQRRDARFINTGMIVSLSGAVASDALEDGTVISGVGGQYNFVAMAHDLPGARSILCIRSTRGKGKQLQSNVVPFYGAATIPKHLRDVVVTEYGVADLRGQSDAEVIARLINIADSRFQHQLLEWAKTHGKLAGDYVIPECARDNTPARLQQALAPWQARGLLPDYPLGTDLTEQELALAGSLRRINALSEEPGQLLATAFRALLHRADPDAAKPFLERIQLEHPETTREFLIQQLLLLDLQERGELKVR